MFDGRDQIVEVAHLPRDGERWLVRVSGMDGEGEGDARVRVQLPTESAPRTLRCAVRRAFPGDEVEVEVARTFRGQMVARAVAMVRRAPERIVGACAHYGDDPSERAACGGCAWQGWTSGAQRAAKEARVRMLARQAGLQVDVAPIVASPQLWSYRNKVELSFGADPDGGLGLGFRPAGYRREVIAQRECRIFSPSVSWIVPWMRAEARARGLTAYVEGKGGLLRTLTLREGKRTGQRMVELTTHADPPETGGEVDEAGESAARTLISDLADHASRSGQRLDSLWWSRQVVGRGVRTRVESTLVSGTPTIEDEVLAPGGRTLVFEVHPRSFFQPNARGAEAMHAVAHRMMKDAGARGTLLDLYCGTGTIGMCLAQGFDRLVGVEFVEEAVVMARRNAEANGIANAAFHAGDTGEVLARLLDEGLDVDAVVVDPPRAGLVGRAVDEVVRTGARTVIYISCNPVTLMRDLAMLEARGMVVRELVPVDLFPHTPHVECIARIERISGV